MEAIKAGIALGMALWGTAALAATAGAEPLQLAAGSLACTAPMRLGQAHTAEGSSIALASGMHADFDEYLEMHAQARETIYRPARVPGIELRVQATHGESLTK